MTCRQPQSLFSNIIASRVRDPECPPGPDALIRQCSNCHLDVWISPRTVEETKLIPAILCWQCADVMLLQEKKQGEKHMVFVMPKEGDNG